MNRCEPDRRPTRSSVGRLRWWLSSVWIGLLASLPAFAQPVQLMHTFWIYDGNMPQGVLVQAPDGAFYGTTHYGGVSAGGSFLGPGTVFRMTTNGAFTTLTDFSPGTNGRYIRAGLVQSRDGMFYGTTYRLSGTDASATIFRGTTNGGFTNWVTLNQNIDGYFIDSGLIEGRDGALYGTASGSSYQGTLFRVDTNRTVTVLANFQGTNGASPRARLFEAPDGTLYGTTSSGGAFGKGTVFQFRAGQLGTLATFDGTNGSTPQAGVIQLPDGTLFGTTSRGGAYNAGTIFKITADGALTTLVQFNTNNGAAPTGDLIVGRNGLIYGTAWGADTNNHGIVFQLSPAGEIATVAQLGGKIGGYPYAGVTQGADGYLYGCAQREGGNQAGTIFRVLLPSLTPRSDGTNMVVSWPTNSAGFVLQTRSSDDPVPEWRDYTNSEVTVVATLNVVTNPITAASMQFRLRRP